MVLDVDLTKGTAGQGVVTGGVWDKGWRLTGAKNERIVFDAGAPVNDITIAGNQIAAACADGKIRIFPLAGGAPRVFSGHKGPAYGVAFSLDGTTLVSTTDRLRLWALGKSPPAPAVGSELAKWLAARTNLTVAP